MNFINSFGLKFKKMKKTPIYIFFILFCFTKLSAQNASYFEAKYRINYNTDIPQEREGILKINVKKKYSSFLIGKKEEPNNSELIIAEDGYGIKQTIKHKDEERFVNLDFNNKTIYSKEIFRGNIFFVKDTLKELKWDLNYTEQKKIGDLLCRKATVNFRGRNYIAWYASEIPLGYGPYKFQGLPGLIVKINDDTMRYSWHLLSFKLLEKEPRFIDSKELKPIITSEKYYTEIRYPSNNEQQSIIQSKLPKGVQLISVSSDVNIRKDIEIKFEWEE